ncbi:winged helix-turn-helix domain-containing protein [Actinoplanes sp. NPDC020271]|uniref:winged helix-turn-helix domain-containing protein n=1 Tax=Actinoplanes sp. NPDC020271 TaxID=3363896 RepID=UPI00378EE120
MTIGIVVHSGQRGRFTEAARTLTGVSFAWAVYEREEEIRDRVTDLLSIGALSGLLLGLVPHARAADLLPPGLPVVITRSAALDLALAWARARGNGWPATPVSIDTFPDETVSEVAGALGLDRSSIATLPFRPEQTVAEVVTFHREQLERSGAPYVITARTGVAAALDGRTAVLPATATAGTIRADLHDLVSRVRSRQAGGQRFAAAVFRAPEPSTREALRQALVELPQLADAWIDEHGPRGVIAFAPAIVFETLTDHWVSLPIDETTGFHGVRDAEPSPAPAVGFGIGGSARSSVALADQAADRAERDGAAAGYLITEDGMMIGPIGRAGPPLAYTYREHGGLEDLAARAGLSAATMSRLAALERSLAGRAITPGELARALGITDPSGRRLIRKLGEAGLVAPVGSAQPHHKGRPTRLYRLAIQTPLASGGGQ